MSDLAEIEKMAREVVHVSNVERRLAEMDDVLLPSTDRENLARFILRALPVIRAAVAWSESFGELSKRLPPHVHELRRAVDEYERALDAFRSGDK